MTQDFNSSASEFWSSTYTNTCLPRVLVMPSPRLPSHLSHKSALVLLPTASITGPIETIRRGHDKQFHRWPPHINLIYPFLTSPSNTSELENAFASSEKQEEGNFLQLREEIRSRIVKAVDRFRPFDTELCAEEDGFFLHSKRSATIWLKPRSTQAGQVAGDVSDQARNGASGILMALQASLQAEFSECNADTRAFRPHLSIGQATGSRSAEKLIELAKGILSDFNRENSSLHHQHENNEVSDEIKTTPEGNTQKTLKWTIDRVFVIERKHFNDRFRVVGSVPLTSGR